MPDDPRQKIISSTSLAAAELKIMANLLEHNGYTFPPKQMASLLFRLSAVFEDLSRIIQDSTLSEGPNEKAPASETNHATR